MTAPINVRQRTDNRQAQKLRVYALAQRPNGVTYQQAADALGIPLDESQRLLRTMVKSERLTNTGSGVLRSVGESLEAVDAAKKLAQVRNGLIQGQRNKGISKPWLSEQMVQKHLEARVRPARQPLADIAPKVETVPIIIPGVTKITVYKTATVDRRYQVEPGESVYGAGFSRLKPGQYIAEASSLAAKALA